MMTSKKETRLVTESMNNDDDVDYENSVRPTFSIILGGDADLKKEVISLYGYGSE